MIEKGRTIEIEAVYVALFSCAFLSWLHGWRSQRSPWLSWSRSLVTGRLRELRHPARLLGIFVMLAIFASWAVRYSIALHSQNLARTWSAEVASRFTGDEIDFNTGRSTLLWAWLIFYQSDCSLHSA
ncbi:MAG: hypothetical protein ACR2HH_05735 [Chthoniobacterales bacterium]